tara:strand:+ start:1513 stop:2709 length:1197 start_codon:yes stop_codon:yes gene_type:complete
MTKTLTTDRAEGVAFKLEKLEKTLVKKGLPSLKIEWSNRRLEIERAEGGGTALAFTPIRFVELIDVTIDSAVICHEGWEFAGVISGVGADENLISAAPSFELPEKFRHVDPNHCDQCKKSRCRKETFILHRKGEFRQVGRNCMKDFLGHCVGFKLSAWASWSSLIDEAVSADGDWHGERPDSLPITVKEWLALSIIHIQEFGFLSKAKANEIGHPATGSEVRRRVFNPDKSDKPFGAPSERVLNMAGEVIEWAQSLDDSSEFNRNLRAAASQQWNIHWRTAGILVAAFPCFQRAKEKQVARTSRKAANAHRKHVGQIGERREFDLKIKVVREFETQFGVSFFTTCEDELGNVIVSKSSVWLGNEGERVTVKATIKEHSEFNQCPQTVINRPKVLQTES